MDSIRGHNLARYGLVLLVTLFLFPAVAGAHRHGDGPPDRGTDMRHHGSYHSGIWRNVAAVDTLGLSDQQLQQLKEADFSHREKRLALQAQLETLRLKMDKGFGADRPDEEALLLIASQIADLQGQVFILKIESRLAMERVLTVEQRKKLNGKYPWQHGGHGNDRHPAVNGKFEKHR